MPRWIFAFLVLCLGILGLLVCTSQSLKTLLHSQGPLHPWFHLVLFGGLAFVLMMSFRRLNFALIAVCFLFPLAWGIEFREHLADGFPVEQDDILLNIIGIAAGTVLGFVGRWSSRKRV